MLLNCVIQSEEQQTTANQSCRILLCLPGGTECQKLWKTVRCGFSVSLETQTPNISCGVPQMEAVSALAVTCLSLHRHKCHLNYSVTPILTFLSSTIRIFLSLLAHQEDNSISFLN